MSVCAQTQPLHTWMQFTNKQPFNIYLPRANGLGGRLRPATLGARLHQPPQRTAHCRTLIERSADGGTGADCAPPVASLSVLGEIAIFVQHGFVNLFTDKRIYTSGSGARARVDTVGGPLLY